MIRYGTEALELSPAVVRALLMFASQDETRPTLSGIGFDLGDVCATDGHALVRFEQVEISPGAPDPKQWHRRLFRRAVVEQALKVAGALGVVRLEWSKLESENARSPQYRQVEVEPRAETMREPIGFNTALLGKLQAAARACRRERVPGEVDAPDDPPAVIVSVGPTMYEPVRYQIGGEHWSTAVHTAHVSLMPMRLGGDEHVIAKAREKVREREHREAHRKLVLEQKQRDRERAKVEREKREVARDEAKRIRARDRAQRMVTKSVQRTGVPAHIAGEYADGTKY